MASRKPARAASGQTKTADSAARSQTTKAKTGQARTGQAKTGQVKTGQARTGQNGRAGQGGRGQDNRGRNGAGAAQGRTTATQAKAAAATAAPPPSTAPRLWFQITALVLSLAGLGMSIYLTIAHYTSTSILTCPDKGYINCAKVTTSPQSMLFGIFPVAVLGLAFYVFMVAINTPWAWRWQHPLIPWVRTIGIITGICFALYLIYAEVIEIGNLCLLCTSVHVITFLLFLLLMSVSPFLSKPTTAAR
jgi:uncharacterized membrane protein